MNEDELTEDHRRRLQSTPKEDTILVLTELLYWKLSEETMTALEKLPQQELDRLVAEARDGIQSRIQPFQIRIAQLQGIIKQLRGDKEDVEPTEG